jgi:acetyl esterase
MPIFNPDVVLLLEAARKSGAQPFETFTPKAARLTYAEGRDRLQRPAQNVASICDIELAGPVGPLPVRIYRPLGAPADELLPCTLFLHGGGWVIGNLDSHDRLCRRLSNTSRSCVVAVDYRLAPEHPFPAALDDALAALRWISAHDTGLHIAHNCIALAGDSAGGNLAAALALMGRDRIAPAAVFQALLYPALDLTAQSPSYSRVTAGVPLTAATMRYFIDHYTPDTDDRLDWRASPLKSTSLTGVPPALMLTVGNDPLCDEGRAYAHRMENDGVQVTSLHLSDQLHGLLMMEKVIGMSTVAVDFVGATLGNALWQSMRQTAATLAGNTPQKDFTAQVSKKESI